MRSQKYSLPERWGFFAHCLQNAQRRSPFILRISASTASRMVVTRSGILRKPYLDPGFVARNHDPTTDAAWQNCRLRAVAGQRGRETRGASSAWRPFQQIWTPMQRRMKAESRMRTVVPVGPRRFMIGPA